MRLILKYRYGFQVHITNNVNASHYIDIIDILIILYFNPSNFNKKCQLQNVSKYIS